MAVFFIKEWRHDMKQIVGKGSVFYQTLIFLCSMILGLLVNLSIKQEAKKLQTSNYFKSPSVNG